MDKKTILAAAAIGLVLMFLLASVALGVLYSQGGSNSQGGSGAGELQGTSFTNITINRYQPYLIVKGGNGSAVEAATAKLKSAGIVEYATTNSGGYIISLANGRDAPKAGLEYEKANASVLATAFIGMPQEITVQGDGITTKAEGTTFDTQLRPIYEEGSRHEAQILVALQGVKIVGLGSFAILPKTVYGAVAVMEIVSAPTAEYAVEVPWEGRAAAKKIALQKGAAYKEKSYIEIPTNASLDSVSAAGKLLFATGAQAGIVSVRNDFADRGLAESQLMLLGLPCNFPPSVASFPNTTGNQSASALVEALFAAGINATLKEASTLTVKLPEYIEKDGQRYYAEGFEITFDTQGALPGAANATVSIDFAAEGSRVGRILGIQIVRE
jgi:hypothetical protein